MKRIIITLIIVITSVIITNKLTKLKLRKGIENRYNAYHQPINKIEKEAREFIINNDIDYRFNDKFYKQADECYSVCKEDYDVFAEFKKFHKLYYKDFDLFQDYIKFKTESNTDNHKR